MRDADAAVTALRADVVAYESQLAEIDGEIGIRAKDQRAEEKEGDSSSRPQDDVGQFSQLYSTPEPLNDNDAIRRQFRPAHSQRQSPTNWLHNSTTSAICFGISAVASAADQRASALRVLPAPVMVISVKPAVRSRPAMMSLLAKHPK